MRFLAGEDLPLKSVYLKGKFTVVERGRVRQRPLP